MKNKILIIEDEPDIGEIMSITLTQSGYKVKVLANGKELKAHIAKFKPNVIMMDLWMPGVDGSLITKELKGKKLTKDIPIILVSARNNLEKIARQVKADGFLAKPFDISSLVSIVKKFT